MITSSHNPIIKAAADLKFKNKRESAGAFLIEGVKLIDEAVKSGADLRQMFVTEKFLTGQAAGIISAHKHISAHIVTDSVMAKITDTDTPQGIAAIVSIERSDALACILPGRSDHIMLFLESVQDPGNVGTIIRTADAAGVDRVFLNGTCADLYNPKTLRSTMGSVFHTPCIRLDGSEAGSLKNNICTRFIAASLDGTIPYYEADFTSGFTLMIGNESSGLSREALRMADITVKIPMPGKAESLNASSAAAVILFEALRQRKAV